MRIAQINPNKLTVEYIPSQSGIHIRAIDSKQPRFCWELYSKARSQFQKAYRILVASTDVILNNCHGDFWDSGRVESSETVGIVYEGLKLESGKRYYWKVMVWDQEDAASTWSDIAWFDIGLLQIRDWEGNWIGWDRGNAEGFSTEGIPWIGIQCENGEESYHAGFWYYRKTFEISAELQVKQAIMAIAADKSFKLHINDVEAAEGSLNEPVYNNDRGFKFVDVTDLVQIGENIIAVQVNCRDISSSALIGKLRVIYKDNTSFEIPTDSSWKICSHLQSGWEQLHFKDENWALAEQIAFHGEAPWGKLALPSLKSPAPLLRKEFRLEEKSITTAKLYICGLGYYVLYINGSKVGDVLLDPAFTNYNKHVLYSTYDVSELLRQGKENCIGVELGRGFYGLRVENEWWWEKTTWNADPKMILQLNIEYSDGTKKTIKSDSSWRVMAGPTLADAIYCGENYDARREKNGWNNIGYFSEDWSSADVMASPTGQLKSQTIEPIKVTEYIKPVAVTNPKESVIVFDMGTVMAGWAEISAFACEGTKMTINYAERLNSGGTIDRGYDLIHEPDFQEDSYVFKGSGSETFEPKFSYKGFRYVQVSGIALSNILSLIGKVLHTSVETIGSFSCSNTLFNSIHEISLRALRSNFHGIITDCPQYEKNGWTADGNLSSEAAMYNYNMSSFYAKWLQDMVDSQDSSGLIPIICPSDGWGMRNVPEWGAVFPFMLWNIYQYYGDMKILQKNYEALKKYIQYIIAELDEDNTANGDFGDWLPPKCPSAFPPEGPKVSATAYVYEDLVIAARIADLVGQMKDAAIFTAKGAEVRAGLNKMYMDEENKQYFTDITHVYRQTETILPVVFGLIPNENKQSFINRLIDDIKHKDNHLDTGILGTKYLFPVLTDNGYGNIAYAIANQKSNPGYGYMISQNATSLWEAWDDYTRSLNHHMFASIDEWFYKYLAGILPEMPGFKTITIKPYVLGDLSYAQGKVDTVRGVVSSAWSVNSNGIITLDVIIPVNTSATIHIPLGRSSIIREGGVLVENIADIKFLREEEGYAVYSVGSGKYHFTS